MESLLGNEYQLMVGFQKAPQWSLRFLPLLFPGLSSNSWFNFQQWFGTKPSPAELINLIFVMNQRKFWGNSDILPFLESFQLLWYFTWNFSFECKIWRNPNINLVLNNLKEFRWSFDLTLVLVQEVQWSARLILVVTVSQASMSVSLSPPSCSQWSSSYSCEQIFIYSTTKLISCCPRYIIIIIADTS